MAENIVELLTDVADAIREKKGSTEKIKAQNFAEEIKNLSSGADNGWNAIVELTDDSHYGNSNIISALLDDGVTELLDDALRGANLSHLNLEHIEKIGRHAVAECKSLVEVVIGNTEIGDYAFAFCDNLAKIVCTSSVPPKIGEWVFRGSPTYIQVPEDSYDAYITAWSEYAERIYTDVPKYEIIGDTEALKVFFSKGIGDGIGLTKAQIEGVKDIGTWFNNNVHITDFSFLEKFTSLTSIAYYAFNYCMRLEVVSFPISIKSLGGYLFQSSPSLKRVNIPESITIINANTFSGCIVLTNVNIPQSCIKIEGSAFNGCSSLQYVVLPKGLTSIGGSVFMGCGTLREISIPEGCLEIGINVFRECRSLKDVSLPSTLTNIGDYTFYLAVSLEKIHIPTGIQTIPQGLFMSCNSLKMCDMRDHNAVPTLSNVNAFNGTSSTLKIVVPDALYDEWIAATNWSTLASKIIKSSEYTE